MYLSEYSVGLSVGHLVGWCLHKNFLSVNISYTIHHVLITLTVRENIDDSYKLIEGQGN